MLRVVCVDDERAALKNVLALCARIPEISDAQGFAGAEEALAWLRGHSCDLALLDICLPGMDGIALAKKIRELQPETGIVFVTGYARYAVDAWAIHACGYVMKPATPERLREEVAHALSLRAPREEDRPAAHIQVKTFGSFDVLVDGEPVRFRRAKAKELLAYLVERQGREITREEAYRALWEKETYDRPAQKQLDVILRSLRETLTEYGIGEMFSMRRGGISVVPGTFSCDMYRFLQGDASAVGAYRGEYMTAYSWASLQEAFLERKVENPKQRMNNEE